MLASRTAAAYALRASSFDAIPPATSLSAWRSAALFGFGLGAVAMPRQLVNSFVKRRLEIAVPQSARHLPAGSPGARRADDQLRKPARRSKNQNAARMPMA